MKCQNLFSRKNIINLSFAKLAQRVVKVKGASGCMFDVNEFLYYVKCQYMKSCCLPLNCQSQTTLLIIDLFLLENKS